MGHRTRAATAVALTVALALAACSAGSGGDAGGTTSTTERSQGGPSTTGPLGSAPSPPPPGIRIEVRSSQPDRVTGDEARIRVTPPAGVDVDEVALTLGDVDVTGQLAVDDGALEGVVRGFVEGNNSLRATAGDDAVVQRVRAWPRTGPVFSGPHLPLLACATEAFGLGAPTDADCSAEARTDVGAIGADGRLAWASDGPLPDPATAEVDGRRVALRVQRERGTLNRATYELAWVDPDPADPDPGAGWNGALVLRFGGAPACTGLYGQGLPPTAAADVDLLRRGYLVATASFLDASVTCNDVLAAETAMMLRERVVEAFGVPEVIVGDATSGGGALAQLLTQDYPGLINGAVVSEGVADLVTTATGATDCALLQAWAATPEGRALAAPQRAAIAGHASAATCATWADRFGGALDPTVGCDPAIDPALVYDPTATRGGVRCTLADAARNQSVAEPGTGFARSPYDNVGVQYGLEALNAGSITAEEFLDLNAGIGGVDGDGRLVDRRTEADPEAVLQAYETGRVSMGGGDQAEVPILALDAYADATGDVHDHVRALGLRDRLAFTGPTDAPGHVLWTEPGADGLDAALAAAAAPPARHASAIATVDAWLRALRDDDQGGPLPDVLARTAPDDAVDTCRPGNGATPIRGDDAYEPDGACTAAFPTAGSPRIAAGGPRSDHVLKCALKAPDPTDYEVPLTRDQFERLVALFPTGVCDWSGPSVGEVVPATPDRSYEDVDTPGRSA